MLGPEGENNAVVMNYFSILVNVHMVASSRLLLSVVSLSQNVIIQLYNSIAFGSS